jgi:hypothetical protein
VLERGRDAGECELHAVAVGTPSHGDNLTLVAPDQKDVCPLSRPKAVGVLAEQQLAAALLGKEQAREGRQRTQRGPRRPHLFLQPARLQECDCIV